HTAGAGGVAVEEDVGVDGVDDDEDVPRGDVAEAAEGAGGGGGERGGGDPVAGGGGAPGDDGVGLVGLDGEDLGAAGPGDQGARVEVVGQAGGGAGQDLDVAVQGRVLAGHLGRIGQVPHHHLLLSDGDHAAGGRIDV